MLLSIWPGNIFLQARLFPDLPLHTNDRRAVNPTSVSSFDVGLPTFAVLRLAQGLNCALSAFIIVVCEYMDLLIKTDRCAHNVDDIGIAANTPDELIENLELVFQSLTKA